MPIYKHKTPGKHLVRLYHHGKPKSWVVEGTKAEALAFEARKRLELAAQGPSEHRTAPPLSELSIEYATAAATRLADGTWRNRKYQIATLVEFFGETRTDRVTPQLIDQYAADRHAAGIGNVKINDDIKVLMRILRWASDRGVPVVVPKFERLPEPAKKGRVRVWTDAHVERLFAAVISSWPAGLPLVTFLLNTGCRKTEALTLCWRHVDLRRGLVSIEPSDEWRPKDNEPREVPISSALRPHLSSPGNPADPVFPSRKGEHYARWPQKQFDTARKAAGLKGGPHTCRHTFASHFLRANPDMFLLAEILGHSHTRVTELYAHLLPDHLERARDVVNLAPPTLRAVP